jgi:Trk K+ transport system NAD-binding subunit
MKVAVLGTGKVGRSLAGRFTELGHDGGAMDERRTIKALRAGAA